MNQLIEKAEIRWADIDPNFHVLHSKYYDYCANARMQVLQKNGVTMQAIQQYNIGPILLREECVFKRELKFGDKIEIRISLKSHDITYTRWSFINEIWKNGDTLAAVITVDGAWMDTVKRKIVAPPGEFRKAFESLPKAEI
jgi:acyl-CoA thioester hydrolase